jgi:hypothetical protein
MPYTKGTCFDPDKRCLPGTHEMILGEIVQWVNSPNEDTVPHIFFLSAVAGYRKSAVAHTIAQQFDKLGHHIALTHEWKGSNFILYILWLIFFSQSMKQAYHFHINFCPLHI